MPIGRIHLPSTILIATTDLLCHACYNLLTFLVCSDNTWMVNRPHQAFNTYIIQYIKTELNQIEQLCISYSNYLYANNCIIWGLWQFIMINDFKAFLLLNLLELSFPKKIIYPIQLPRFVKSMHICYQKCYIIYINIHSK